MIEADHELEARVKQVQDLFQEKVRGASQRYFDECSIHARGLIAQILSGKNPDITGGWPHTSN